MSVLENDTCGIAVCRQPEDIRSLAKRLDPIEVDPSEGGGEGGGSESSSPLSDPPSSEVEGSEGGVGQEAP